jgi:multiple sugar transport system ATP-binding protein
VVCGVRPEDVALSAVTATAVGATNGMPQATVDLVELVGSDSYVSLTRDDVLLQSRVPADQEWREGQRVGLAFNPRKLHFFSKRTGANLAGGLTS